MPDWQVYDWREEALCAATGYPEAWFSGAYAFPRKVCALCPVRQECLMYAIEHGEAYGLWGGKTENERRKYAADNGIPYEAKWLSPDDEDGGLYRPDVDTDDIRALREQGQTYEQIADVVGMDRTGVSRRLRRAEKRSA